MYYFQQTTLLHSSWKQIKMGCFVVFWLVFRLDFFNNQKQKKPPKQMKPPELKTIKLQFQNQLNLQPTE